jgi:endo-1,3(4)-beta-glucanase
MELTETTGLLDAHRKYHQQKRHRLPTTQLEAETNEKSLKSIPFYLASGFTILIFILFITIARTLLSPTLHLSNAAVTTQVDPNTNGLNSISHPETPSSYWGTVKKPYPTGAFWTNLVVGDGDGAVAVLPYGVKCVQSGVQISYGPTRRSVTNKWIRDTFDVDLQISTVQPYTNRGVSSYDEISVTMSYDVSGGSYKAFLVKGSPFLTITFQGSTPTITSATMHVTNMELHPIPSSLASSFGGLVYIVTLGNFQKWIVYCSDATVPLVWKDDTIVASSPSHGFIRIGILPSVATVNGIDSLLPYLPTYPTGVDVDIQYSTQEKQTISTLQYKFKTQSNAPSGTPSQLLMLALPHHMEIITNPTADLKLKSIFNPIWTIKGKMTPLVSDTWTLQYTLLNPGWIYDLEGRVIPTSNLNAIGQALQLDVLSVPPYASNPYGFGKQSSRLANLALIADNLGIADARQKALTKIENTMTSWLVQSNTDSLLYDTTYGGIIPTLGVLDKQADYGSGWYNDHHFHYGYFIYTSAVLIHLDNPYYQSHKLLFDSLIKDICNHDKKNKDYPYARHKDFFDGHSWASGLFQQANGKGQESSSEVFFLQFRSLTPSVGCECVLCGQTLC